VLLAVPLKPHVDAVVQRRPSLTAADVAEEIL
jgi:hypothetical protein